jgi:hypothetical protein
MRLFGCVAIARAFSLKVVDFQRNPKKESG